MNKKNRSGKNEKIEELEIQLKHISNEYAVIEKHYEKTTGEYFEIVEEITKANKQLQQEITERKKVEKELKKVHEELEQRILDRTAELAQVNEDLHTDIIEREKAEKALIESKNLYLSTIDSMADAIHLINDKFEVIMHNAELDTWHHRFGLSRIIDGQSIFELYPFLSDTVREEYDVVFKKGEIVVTEELLEFGGGPITTETRKIPVFDNGRVVRVITILRDITARKKAEKALDESKGKFRELVDLLPETIWESDLEGNLIYISQKGFALTGYTRKDYDKGINILQFLTDEDIERAKKNISDIVKGKNIGSNEYSLLKKDGSSVPVLIHTNLLVQDGKPTGLRGIIIDISERLKLEEQIQIRQRMDSLGTLAGGIAHDFNNILACVMGYLELLSISSNSLPSSQKNYIEEAYQSCQRAAGLIKEFQALSIEPLQETSSVDIYKVAHEVFTILERTTDKIIEKKNELKPGQIFVKGKADQIHHVLLNLGTNAVNAIEEKGTSTGGLIKISAQEKLITEQDPTGLPKGNYIHIFFEDTGVGMSKEVKRRAFEPLFSTKMRGSEKGQGLGLTMVYNIIIRNHKGYIDIDTKEGFGTTFHIFLPKAVAIDHSKSVQRPTFIGGKETILIIEDEDPIRELTSEFLTEYGYTIISASDGLAGLEMYKEKQDDIELILLDLTMPKLSGKKVLEKVIKLNSDVKVIISSGHSEDEMKKYHHAKGFIAKPYKLKDLLHYIRSVLDN